MAFMMVGLQIGPIWENLAPAQRGDYAVFALAVLWTCVAARFAWVMGYGSVVRFKNHVWGAAPPAGMSPPTARSGLVVAWAGMRGVVSLAAAYALPADFPMRDLILLSVFVVVMGTLVVQGLTLGPLIRALRLGGDDTLDADIRLARIESVEAALKAIEGRTDPQAERLRADYSERRAVLNGVADGDGRILLPVDDLSLTVLQAKRDRLLTLRLEGTISDAAYYQLEEELDRHELALTPVVR
jgi:monovalent cation/hydrogen antiporter